MNKNLILLIIVSIVLVSFTNSTLPNTTNKREKIAKQYFESFHEGNLDRVFKYLAEDCTVKYKTEKPKMAKAFFENTKELIASLEFHEKGVYTSEQDSTVLIYFSFSTPKTNNNASKTIEAVDIIKFNQENQIKEIKVISNE